MYSINDLIPGLVINLNNQPYEVISSQHLKLGRGGAIIQTKLKNLITGNILERNFKGSEKISPASLDKKSAQYLYQEKDAYFFMDSSSFEQLRYNKEVLDDAVYFLKEGEVYNLEFFRGDLIRVQLPVKINLKVKKTEKGIKGDRVTAGTKPATLETGLSIDVPLFIKEGNTVKVDTRNKSYIERVS